MIYSHCVQIPLRRSSHFRSQWLGLALQRRLFASPPSTQQQPATLSSSTKIGWFYPVIGGFFITVAGGIKYVHDHVGGTEGLMRSISFYKYAIPKYLEYRWHMYNQSPDHIWDELDKNAATEGLKKAYELEGFYIKGGQMVAANMGGAFPQIWQDTMSVLQDQVPPQDFEVIRKIVKEELPNAQDIFATFEETPIGSAAIGQVHRATLKRDGTPVVVKVRYPNVERILRGDVRTIKMFAQIAQPVHVPALEEIEKQFMTEFDYVQEAEQLNQVQANLKKAGLEGPGKLCRVPKAYMEFCTERVLVMDELHGGKLADGLKKEAKQRAEQEGKTVKQYMADVRQQEEEAKAKGEELKGPTKSEYEFYIGILDKKRKLTNIMHRSYNWTVGLLPGKKVKPIEDKSSLPINHAKMIDDLLHIHGHEILVDGFFNGDPHPGNILLLREKDGSPALGLIDYGQVKRISKETRHLFAKLVIALDEDDKEQIVALMKEAGMKTKNNDPEVFYLYAKVSYAEITEKILQGRHIQVLMEDLEKRDPIVQLPLELIMVSRCSILLRGLALALHQNRNVATAWRPIAERVLEENI
ncbi:2-octaprenylphenol hydroxylase [Nitzschia inconspicua]|uniref:2-octaprenylphenol hydroxylase n=1 Tax=Nitzschia inconspicua TaxID=303405 RepID=A0A9K3LP87_9STRA|nr:2-octaprenylphenol hydroxylase [Nitzschia inconspicua]